MNHRSQCKGGTNLQKRDLRGSKLRCLLLTGLPSSEFLRVLQEVVHLNAIDTQRAEWMPRGICAPKEPELDKAPLLREELRKQLKKWWLGKTVDGRRTPNWDIGCACVIEKQNGLVLVEAKAHKNELNANDDGKIGDKVREANDALNAIMNGWSLDNAKHYQLSNRFAWAWKLAELKVPVVLVYLGFLNANEMGQRVIFKTHKDWENYLRTYAKGIVPDGVWGQRLEVNGTPIFPLIRSLDLSFIVGTGS